MKYTYSSSDLNKAQPSGGNAAQGKAGAQTVKRGHGAGFWVGLVAVVVVAGIAVFLWMKGDRAKEGAILVAGASQGSSQQQRAKPGEVQKADDRDIALFLVDTETEVRQLFEYVRQSSFICGNEQYAKKMKDVRFIYSATNDVVNAYAGPDPSDSARRVMNCFAGEVRLAKVLGLAAAAQLCGEKGSIAKLMDKLTPRLCSRLSLEDAAKLICECGFDACLANEGIRTKAKSIAAGEVVGTLAHETGHIVLGHLEGKDPKIWLNMEVRRNYESQADLVASSIMSTSPFGEYVFMGQVFYYWVNMQKTDSLIKQNVPKNELDHPLHRERYAAFVLANKEKAAAFGFPIPEL